MKSNKEKMSCDHKRHSYLSSKYSFFFKNYQISGCFYYVTWQMANQQLLLLLNIHYAPTACQTQRSFKLLSAPELSVLSEMRGIFIRKNFQLQVRENQFKIAWIERRIHQKKLLLGKEEKDMGSNVSCFKNIMI